VDEVVDGKVQQQSQSGHTIEVAQEVALAFPVIADGDEEKRAPQ
jgi:hypothetical protein